jgi:ABC-type branched-subunit amino acid transport system substrate-binding protein
MALLLVAAACGDEDDGAESEGSPDTEDPAVECSGEPIKLGSLVNESGPLAFGTLAEEAQLGIDAALQAVNGECTLGRPIEVDPCDERSDANESTACGREAAENGTLAWIARTGLFSNGVDTAELPGVYANGSSVWELTNPQALSSQSVISQLLACATFPIAAGYDDVLFVSAESPEAQGSMATIQSMVAELGGSADSLFYPPETTDFAPVAAQVQERDPASICLVANEMVPMVNALADVGITPDSFPIVSGAVLVPPHILEELGDAAEGMILVSQLVSPSETDNPGIADMLDELEAAGIDAEDSPVSTETVYYWSSIHTLVDALSELTPEQIETLDSATLQEAVAAYTPVERPEVAPYDFTEPAFKDTEALAAFRIFNRNALAVKVEDGGLVQVTDFVDVESPPELDFG